MKKKQLLYIPIFFTLVLSQGGLAPDVNPEHEKLMWEHERWIENINEYSGYQKLLRQVDSDNALEIIRLIETSEYPEMTKAIIEVESAWRVNAHSHRDARGLMQIRPIAAFEIDPDLSPEDIFDPVVNVCLGIRIFKEHMEYFMGFDDPEHWALTSYNRGRSGTFALDMQPPNTRYSRKVLGRTTKM